MARLIWSARQEYRTKKPLSYFILIGVYTGARRGAIMDLEWSQIDLDKRTMNFNKAEAGLTNKRRAQIPIGRKLHAHLSRL